MRWPASLSLFLLLRACQATSATQEQFHNPPRVYLYDPDSSLQSHAQLDYVDAHVASLIFADRLSITQHLSIGEITDIDLEHLNKYKAASSIQTSEKHLFAVIDNAHLEKDYSSVPGLTTFQLSISPTVEDGRELSQKFTSYIEKTHGALRQWQNVGTNVRNFDVIYESGSSVETILEQAIKDKVALTLVVNPRPASGSGSKHNVYGDLPSIDGKKLARRQEAPLLEPISATYDITPSTSSSPQIFATSAAKLPLTAQCYDTADSCMSETNSCSGHGECVLARKAPASGEGEAAECYQCKCGKSEKKNNDGSIKTTYYGGSACQKEDISAPFWLLTITAGSLLALVGFGVSMLYAMGNAELPSVIGAGVSGPKAK